MITASLAIIWTVIFYGLAGNSIRNIRNGKPGRFAIIPPPPERGRVINTSGFTSVSVSGIGYTIIIKQYLNSYIRIRGNRKNPVLYSVRNDTLSIRLGKVPLKSVNDTLFIFTPHLHNVTLYSYKIKNAAPLSLVIKDFSSSQLKVITEGVSPFLITNCQLSDFIIRNNNEGVIQKTNIASSNHIDSLLLEIPGPGDLELRNAGIYKNNLRLSGFVNIRSTSGILTRIRLQP